MKLYLPFLVLALAAPVLADGWSKSNPDGTVNTQAGDDSDTSYTAYGSCESKHSTDDDVHSIASNTHGVTAGLTASATTSTMCLAGVPPESGYASAWAGCDVDNNATTDYVDVRFNVTLSIPDSADESSTDYYGYADFGNISFEFGFDNGELWLDVYDGTSWTYDVATDGTGSHFSVTHIVRGVVFSANDTEYMESGASLSRAALSADSVTGYTTLSIDD